MTPHAGLVVAAADEPEKRRGAGRRPALTREQREEIRRRYAVYLNNRPARLCREYGISNTTLKKILTNHNYVNDATP